MNKPPFQTEIADKGVRFHAWAPNIGGAKLILENHGNDPVRPMVRSTHGCFSQFVEGIGGGQLYRYELDGRGPFPDPASRFQPKGVHGPSQIVAPYTAWSDHEWLRQTHAFHTIYELHVGAFSEEGTFAGVEKHLPYLAELGIDAIELMPVADFPGNRNWGYDGVSIYAPSRCYGTPQDLCRLIDNAHRRGLGVLLDVVYNHFGPDGNYLGAFTPFFTSRSRQGPWGDAINLDGEESAFVRRFFIDNAIHWFRDYHVDGLRLDATHTLFDNSPEHFLAQFSQQVRAAVKRPVTLIAEDERSLRRIVTPIHQGGYGFDAVWADDFHHVMRRLTAGDHEGYYADYQGTTEELAAVITDDLAGVLCIQNHDQIGNRAFGERLHHQIDEAMYRAASALLLLLPQRVLLFMGQEWAASSPFLFFTDHNEELGRLVTEGRRKEFAAFSQFQDPKSRDRIPDPQSESTFLRSRVTHAEKHTAGHERVLRYYQQLLKLRRWILKPGSLSLQAFSLGENAIAVKLKNKETTLLNVVRLKEQGLIDLESVLKGAEENWNVVCSSEDTAFVDDARPMKVSLPFVDFSRPGAILFERG